MPEMPKMARDRACVRWTIIIFELRRIFFRKKFKNPFDKTNSLEYGIIRKSRTIGSRPQNINLPPIGDTTKKTINRTLAIGAAFTAAVILAPATTFAHDHHEPPTNGIQLATDIVNLVRAIVEPRPAPVIVEAPPRVVEKTVVVETKPVVVETKKVVTTTPPGTVIVTGAEAVGIPEFSYILYEEEYIPYYDGWIFYRDEWHWAKPEPRPAVRPRWTPPPRRHDDRAHKVIVLPEKHHIPAPVVVRHDPPRHAPAPVVVHRHEEPRREPASTVVVRPEKKDAPRAEAPKTVPAEKKDAKPGAPRNHDAPPAKKR